MNNQKYYFEEQEWRNSFSPSQYPELILSIERGPYKTKYLANKARNVIRKQKGLASVGPMYTK